MKRSPAANQRHLVKNPAKRGSRGGNGNNHPAFRNPALPVSVRVKDLLSRMTLEEKAAQMMCVWQEKTPKLVDARGNFDFKKAKAAFKQGHGLGQVGRPSDAGKGKDAQQMAELTNAIQKFFLECSRLGIPVIFHEECLRGHAAIGGNGQECTRPAGFGRFEYVIHKNE